MQTAAPAPLSNPFPGLRPFRENEEHLFFGREGQVDAMVNVLAARRFLAVIGSSGSGKSSLVNCGLRPALHRGLMGGAGTSWRVAQFRPGHDPIPALAAALGAGNLLFPPATQGRLSVGQMLEDTLRMSRLGLIETIEMARLEPHVNVLIVADQFEELFRYRNAVRTASARRGGLEDATAFVNLLLETSKHPELPIYIVLTMRSDFLGDCAQFQGLPEALNGGQYLVPRLTREERRAAIAGPIAVGGGTINPVLLSRLINDVGDNPDQLSILQHALNRTWAYWANDCRGEGPLSIEHYEAIGTMAGALDKHADKAYSELDERRQTICKRIFQSLTDMGTDARGVRRPTSFGDLCKIADAEAADVGAVIEAFRKPSRSFLMPPAGDPLLDNTVVDISHESLMRLWRRLEGWAHEQAEGAQLYRRLSDDAARHEEGKAALMVDPELTFALQWRERMNPTAAWAEQYGGGFMRAMIYLEASRIEQVLVTEKQHQQEQRELRQAQKLAEQEARSARLMRWGLRVAAAFVVVLVVIAWWALRQREKAKENAGRAEENARVATKLKNDAVGINSSLIEQKRTADRLRKEAEKAEQDLLAEKKNTDALHAQQLKEQQKTLEAQMEAARTYKEGYEKQADFLLKQLGPVETPGDAAVLWGLLSADEPLVEQVVGKLFSPEHREKAPYRGYSLRRALMGSKAGPDKIRERMKGTCSDSSQLRTLTTLGVCIELARSEYPANPKFVLEAEAALEQSNTGGELRAQVEKEFSYLVRGLDSDGAATVRKRWIANLGDSRAPRQRVEAWRAANQVNPAAAAEEFLGSSHADAILSQPWGAEAAKDLALMAPADKARDIALFVTGHAARHERTRVRSLHTVPLIIDRLDAAGRVQVQDKMAALYPSPAPKGWKSADQDAWLCSLTGISASIQPRDAAQSVKALVARHSEAAKDPAQFAFLARSLEALSAPLAPVTELRAVVDGFRITLDKQTESLKKMNDAFRNSSARPAARPVKRKPAPVAEDLQAGLAPLTEDDRFKQQPEGLHDALAAVAKGGDSLDADRSAVVADFVARVGQAEGGRKRQEFSDIEGSISAHVQGWIGSAPGLFAGRAGLAIDADLKVAEQQRRRETAASGPVIQNPVAHTTARDMQEKLGKLKDLEPTQSPLVPTAEREALDRLLASGPANDDKLALQLAKYMKERSRDLIRWRVFDDLARLLSGLRPSPTARIAAVLELFQISRADRSAALCARLEANDDSSITILQILDGWGGMITTSAPGALDKLVVERVLRWPDCPAGEAFKIARELARRRGVSDSSIVGNRPGFVVIEQFTQWAQNAGYDFSNPVE